MLRPPVGVALLGFLCLMAGFAFLDHGPRYAGFVVFGRGDIGDGLLLWGILTLPRRRSCSSLPAFALWATQPWGWLFAHFLAIFGLLDAFFVMIANNSFIDGLAVAIFPLVVLWYLNDRTSRPHSGSFQTRLGLPAASRPERDVRDSPWGAATTADLPLTPRSRSPLEAAVRVQEAAGIDPVTDGGLLRDRRPRCGLARHLTR